MKRLPLHDRHGAVVAHALVDDIDFPRFSSFRWCFGTKGYVIRCERTNGINYTFRLHREVLGLARGDGMNVDHINRNKLDNRRANLRTVTPAQNNENTPAHRSGTSNFRGVSLFRQSGKWRATARHHGHLHHLGLFVSEKDAAKAAQAFRLQHMPFSTEVPL